MQHLPNDATIENRDTYYWYYGTQILRHIGGDAGPVACRLAPITGEYPGKRGEIGDSGSLKTRSRSVRRSTEGDLTSQR